MTWGLLIEALLSWFPRWGVCRKTHRGIKFGRKGKTTVIKPGWYFYIPLCTDPVLLPVVPQTVRLPFQSIMSGGKESKPVHLRVTLVYVIEDIKQALVGAWDLDGLVQEIGASAVVSAVRSKDVKTFGREIAKGVRTELARETRKLLRPYGIKVLSCRVTDYVAGKVYRMIGDAQYVLPDEEEEV